MPEAMIILTWLCGTVCGSLWGAAMDRKEYKTARIYAHYMALCYSLCLLVLVLS